MKIVIVGAGAMGSLYGGYLSVAGNDVWLLDVMEDHIRAIQEKGLCIEEKDSSGEFADSFFRTIRATNDASEIGTVDLAIIFVKSIHTEYAVEQNRSLFGPETIVLTLQNGMGNVDAIAVTVDRSNIIAGTTAHGATMLEAGRIRHAGIGKTILGELNGTITPRVQNLAVLFQKAGLDVDVTDNVIGLLWDKLLVNVGINALTAILEVKNGRLLEVSETEELLEKAVTEAQRVAEAKGIVLNFKDPVAHTKEICKATAENNSSMLQDIQYKRKTEIEMINGAIVREGRAVLVDTPINQALTDLIKSKEVLR